MITAIRSLLLVLASILAGKIVVYTSRTALNIVTMVFAMILLFFMLFWEREPSYVAIFLLAIGLGTVNGSVCSISAGKYSEYLLIHYNWFVGIFRVSIVWWIILIIYSL